jgi:hypothetical protein
MNAREIESPTIRTKSTKTNSIKGSPGKVKRKMTAGEKAIGVFYYCSTATFLAGTVTVTAGPALCLLGVAALASPFVGAAMSISNDLKAEANEKKASKKKYDLKLPSMWRSPPLPQPRMI